MDELSSDVTPPDTMTPVYDGPCRLLDWRHAARDGMTVDLQLSMPGPLAGHPFRNLQTGKESGQRLRVRCMRARDTEGMEVIYDGEAILLRWSENDRLGMSCRFMLDDGPDGEIGRHPFFGLAIGRTTGEPLDLRAIAIDDDESEIPPSQIRRRTPFHQLTEVKQSQILCRDPRFRQFLRHNIERFVPDTESRQRIIPLGDHPEGFPAAVVRAALNVESRAVMNQNSAQGARARQRWHRIMSIYMDQVWNRPWLGKT